MSGQQARLVSRSPADVVGTLVRLAFLVRLIALVFAVVVLAVQGGGLVAVAIFCVLVGFSHLGLQRPAVRRAVVRHPVLALPDLALVSAVPVLVGVNSPLTLVAVSSALLVGVLFAPRTSAPLALLLATTYALAATDGGRDLTTEAFTFPVVLVSVAAIGLAFRRTAEQQRDSEAESAAARAAAAAAHERLRLARDLHDTVAKSVHGVALTTAAIPGWLARDPAVAERHAHAAAAGARAAVTAARDLLTSLRLDDPERPLADVLDELAVRWEADRGTVVERDLEPVEDLLPGQRHELVRAVSEALENVARHAGDARVVLRLRHETDAAVAEVVDDGPGFPADRPAEAEADGHFGLVGMKERLEAAGGTAEVRSALGRGTQVRLRVPYPVHDDHGRTMEGVVG